MGALTEDFPKTLPIGMSPDDVQALQGQLADNNALQMARLAGTPGALQAYNGALFGQGVGNAIQSLAGYEDPQITRAKKLQDVMQQTEQTIPYETDPLKHMQLGIAKLNQAGLYQEAAQALQHYQTFAKAQSEMATGQAALLNAQKTNAPKVKEIVNAGSGKIAIFDDGTSKPLGNFLPDVAELAKTGKFDPATLDKFAKTGVWNDVQLIDKQAAGPDIQKLQDYKAQVLAEGGSNDDRLPAINDAIKKATTHQPPIQVSTTIKQEGAEAQTVGTGFGKEFLDTQKAGISAPTRIAKLNRLGLLLGDFNGGKLAETGLEIAGIANSLGLNVDPKLGNKQAAQALTNEIALTLRSTGDGGGMPGSMSDSDREFLKAMAPGIGKSAAANKLMIDAGVKMAKREQDIAQMARDYRKKNGTFDAGFYDMLQNYSNAHPLFPTATNTKGWKLHFDKNGNAAYINPANPQQYEVVQ